MANKNELLFEKLKPRYEDAYLKLNARSHERIVYQNGWVRLDSWFFETSVRVARFERMTQELERRVKDKV